MVIAYTRYTQGRGVPWAQHSAFLIKDGGDDLGRSAEHRVTLQEAIRRANPVRHPEEMP